VRAGASRRFEAGCSLDQSPAAVTLLACVPDRTRLTRNAQTLRDMSARVPHYSRYVTLRGRLLLSVLGQLLPELCPWCSAMWKYSLNASPSSLP
jgi:hypothetical protein